MFTYIRYKTPIGVKIEEISGGESFSPRAWRMLAGQVWSENGPNGYRAIDHYPDGAPYSEEDERISLTHTRHLMVVATLPRTPEESDLSRFSPRAALGVDAEAADRAQCLKVRDRYLNPVEQQIVPADDLTANVLAWTIKEAVYKAMLTPGLPLIEGIEIKSLPRLHNGNINDSIPAASLGEAFAYLTPDADPIPFILYSYLTDGIIVTLAITPATSTYRKSIQ